MRLSLKDFWSHVWERTSCVTNATVVADKHREAKVDDLEIAFVVNYYILRLQVSMHNTALVDVLDGIYDLHCVVLDIRFGKQPFSCVQKLS